MLYRKGLRTIKGATKQEGPPASLKDRARAIFDMTT